jgi:HSP20 family protein
LKRPRVFGPTVEIGRLQAELNRLFAGILETHRAALSTSAMWDPGADVHEDEREIRIVIDLPGVLAKDVSLRVQAGTLFLHGTKRPADRPARGVRFLCMERYFGDFEKMIPLPGPVNVRAARAKMTDGLLTVSFPRVADQRRRAFDIPIEPAEGGSGHAG